MNHDHERRSRRLNAALGGSPAELLCSRLYRNRVWAWPLVALVDAWACVVWREPRGHCARIHMRERQRRLDDLAARARLFEGQ